MVTILLQKILDLLREKLGAIGNFIASFFISEPQDGQALVYDAEQEKWVNDNVEPAIKGTASGEIATFNTDVALHLPSAKFGIVASQESGTPTPSSPKAITGYTGINVTQAKKNILDLSTIEQGAISDNGVEATATNRIRTVYIKVNSSSAITCSLASGFKIAKVQFYSEIDTNISFTLGGSQTLSFTTPANCKYLRLVFGLTDNTSIIPSDLTQAQLEFGSSATTYEAYNGTTYPVSWQTEAGTVYGGEVDVTTGKLKVTNAIINMEDLNWNYVSANQYFQVAKPIGASTNAPLLCSCYKYTGSSVDNLSIFQTGSYFRVQDIDYTTASDFKTSVTGQKICYGLATPIEYDLTPVEITALVGTNNIWGDTNGNAEVECYTGWVADIIKIANRNIDISSSITVNTTDFSSVSYKVIRSGNVIMISLYSATVVNSYPETLFSGLPKGYNNANVIFIDSVSGDIVSGFLTATGYLNAANAQADQKIGALITYITKDEV